MQSLIRNTKKVLLFFSSFIPLYFLVLTKVLVELINANIRWNVLNTLMVIFLMLFIIGGIIGVVLAIQKSGTTKRHIKIISAKNITDQHFLNYFSLFVLFGLSFELEKVSMSVVFFLIIIFIGIVYVKNNLFYINPFLNLIGYSFYDIEFEVDGNVRHAKVFYRGKLGKGDYEAFLGDFDFSMVYDINYLKNK